MKHLARARPCLFFFSLAVCIILQLSLSQRASAQYFQLSSSGTSTDLDSIANNFAAKNKPQLNRSLYREKVNDSLKAQLAQYKGKYGNAFVGKTSRQRAKYDSAFGRIRTYRNKYTGNVRKDLERNGLSEKMNKLKKKTDYDKNYNKYMNVAGKVGEAKSLTDQLLSGKLKLDSNTVLNSKLMKTYLDSLNKTMPKPPTNPFEEVPKEQLLKEVKQKFDNQRDSLQDSSKWIAEGKKKKEWVDLNYAKLKDADKDDLKPMATAIVTEKVLKHLDSTRLDDLKNARMKMQEKETGAREKIAKFRQMQSFWDKSYLEGIVSMAVDKTSAFQFSPAWAYHILPDWSVGGGPNLMIDRQAKNFKVNVGARFLTKYEILNRSTYFQVEDRVNPGTVGRENKLFTQHNLLAGGGYVIPILSPITFNLSVMYKFYSTGEVEDQGSAWTFRIGLSTNKKQK